MERKYRLLILDDNTAIHQDFKKILLHEKSLQQDAIDDLKSKLFGEKEPSLPSTPSYEIDSAFQGEEGVDLVKKSVEEHNPYALAFIDVLMPPGIDGIEAMKKIWEADSQIQIVICTAYAEYSWEEIVKNFGINDNFLILKKPFESIEIRQLVCCLTKKWSLEHEAGHKYDRLHQEILDEAAKLKKHFSRMQGKNPS